uniref:Uncharacterized protein n=1 Tax=uncultured marine virus TaxID=186617 RepID=A0A0F7L087_9VIRU|nr:hypothetical protein [uncultured marine virus]
MLGFAPLVRARKAPRCLHPANARLPKGRPRTQPKNFRFGRTFCHGRNHAGGKRGSSFRHSPPDEPCAFCWLRASAGANGSGTEQQSKPVAGRAGLPTRQQPLLEPQPAGRLRGHARGRPSRVRR